MVFNCKQCGIKFSRKNNLKRHEKSHSSNSKSVQCPDCDKSFFDKQHMQRHLAIHSRPNIPMYRDNEARLAASNEAKTFVVSKAVDKVWWSPSTAQEEARRIGGDGWRSKVVVTFGKYMGSTFQWLIENDVGWVVWLLHQYLTQVSNFQILEQ